MKVHLLDVNALIALAWPAHEAHMRVQSWFAANSRTGWATCPFTEAAFVRILSNPAFSRDAVAPLDAIKVLAANLEHPSHHFWPDDIGFATAVESFGRKIIGHQQVTDSYLLGLAIHHGGKLATLDRAVTTLLPKSLREAGTVAFIR